MLPGKANINIGFARISMSGRDKKNSGHEGPELTTGG